MRKESCGADGRSGVGFFGFRASRLMGNMSSIKWQ
jgi:hypothetical protein